MPRSFTRLLLSLFLSLLAANASIGLAQNVQYSPALNQARESGGFHGAIVTLDTASDKYLASDTKMVHTGFIPASTFKIFSSLVALETGVVSHDDLLIWDGVVRDRSEINRDLTLVEAFALSALPHYQQLVREIGKAEMKGFLTSVGYGNANMDGGLDRFWIDGGLRISPIQQVQFLERLLANRLPFSLETMKTVKKLLLNAYPDPSISAKTGWTDIEGQNFGWWVGWKVNQGDPVVFATILLTDSPGDGFGKARIDVTRKVLSLDR